jgi:F420-dependent oxidoreductase-like protein
MRTGIFLNYAGGFREAVDDIVELEKIGVDIALVAEAYSYDAISQLGYLAAKTSRIELGSGVVPIYIRTPSLLAMTAAGLDYVSDGRFRLGIGTSGPQVMEGFHGVPFDAPLGRTREVVDICRQVWRRERVQYDGKYYQIPLPPDRGTGLGKPLQLINHLSANAFRSPSPRWARRTSNSPPKSPKDGSRCSSTRRRLMRCGVTPCGPGSPSATLHWAPSRSR